MIESIGFTGGIIAAQLTIQNARYQVTVHQEDDRAWLQIGVKVGPAWETVVVTGAWDATTIWNPDRILKCEDPDVAFRDPADSEFTMEVATYRWAERQGSQLALQGTFGSHALTTYVSVTPHQGVRFVTQLELTTETQLARCFNHLYFAPQGKLARSCDPLDFAWLPGLHKKASHVCADHFFRAPLVVVVARGRYAALIPDLDIFSVTRDLPHALDLRVTDTLLEGPRLSYGLCASEVDGHVYFDHRPAAAPTLPAGELMYAFNLHVGRCAAPAEVTRHLSAALWQQYGRPLMAAPQPQVLPFAVYGDRYTFRHELPASVRYAQVAGDEGAGIENKRRHGANFHAWENDMHVGYGLRHYGQRRNSPTLRRIADGILHLMRAAPRRQGAFPCIYNFDEAQYEGTLFWTARSVDARHGYDTGAMSVTMWWLLKWIDDFPELDAPALLNLAAEYCTLLMDLQLISGAIPTYLQSDLASAAQLKESATTAISGAVLAQCAFLLKQPEYTRAAIRAGHYIENQVLPGLRFNDFETFYSCSPKPLHAMDYWSGICPHNNLSMQWACDMYLALYRRTKEITWLESGEFLLSVLSLYQQVWNPSHLPGHLFGGFGVMNTDGEWNDGRQARFSTTYADYYAVTGEPEYMERAIAACRSSFALMDIAENHANHINSVEMPHLGAGQGYAPENIHHRGRDTGYGWSGMNWSSAGGLAASAYLERRWGAVYLDVAARQAFAIDGVTVQVATWTEDAVSLNIASALRDLPLPYREAREITLRAGGWERLDRDPADLNLTLNGEGPFAWTPELQEDGLRCQLPA